MSKVKVYSTPVCPYCVTLKEFLKSHNVEFEEIDVSENEQARRKMVEESNQMGVPVVEIDGEVVVGFDREKISQALGLKE